METFEKSAESVVVMDALSSLGLLDAINKKGYILSIYGEPSEGGDGQSDDVTKHRVVIEKEMFIGKANQCNFVTGNRIKKDTIEYEEALKIVSEANLRLTNIIGIKTEVQNDFSVDDKRLYHNNKMVLQINRGSKEEQPDYVTRMFKHIVDSIIHN